jgi:transposase
LSETKKYRKFSAQQKTEIVLASLRGNKTMAELCREHDIADSLLRKWREQFMAAGAERLSGKTERTEADELRQRVAKLERAWTVRRWRSRSRGNSCGDGSEHARPSVPASSSRKAAPPPWSPASPGSAARRSTAARPGRRRATAAGSMRSTRPSLRWRAGRSTRPTEPA